VENEKLNLASMAAMFADEDKARAFVESKRWPNGPVCPHCECTEVYTLTPKSGSTKPVRPGVYKCKACRQQFTVRIGTIYEESKIPLCKWLMAIHLMTSSKKGISSHQIAREIGITVKSTWFLTQRIREAMTEEPVAGMLKDVVEVDETYVGGKPRIKGESKRGRGTDKKPVMVLVERNGSGIRCKPVERVDGRTLKNEIAVVVAKDAALMTDEFAAYRGVDKERTGGHFTVNHGEGEYVRRTNGGLSINTNTAESFFALLKRGHYGIFHHLSKNHLHRYCNEFGFRWEHRKVSDGERMIAAMNGAEGKRLMYK
jgi:transposase-like protein